MSIAYKAIARNMLEYACPIWSPIISESSWNKLQGVQNKALKIITGNLKMASDQHIYQETKIMSFKEHCIMKTKQYLLTCHQPDHPGYKHVHKLLPPRKHQETHITDFQRQCSTTFTYRYRQQKVQAQSCSQSRSPYLPGKPSPKL